MKPNAKLAAAKIAAKILIAAADAAEVVAAERGYPLTVEELNLLGYIETEGGVWELPIPIEICKLLVAEDEQEKNAKSDSIASGCKPNPQ